MRRIFTLLGLCPGLFGLTGKCLAQANTSLSNLATPTSVNTSLLPGTSNTYNLGSANLQWNNLFSNNLISTGTAQLNNLFVSGNMQLVGSLNFLGGGGINFSGGSKISFGVGSSLILQDGTFDLEESRLKITPGIAGVLLSDASGNVAPGPLTLAQIPSLSSLYLPLTGGHLTGRLELTQLRAGGTRFPETTGTKGQVLAVNGSGDASWQSLPAVLSFNSWSLTGNAGTVDGTNFIGTTDNVPLTFRVNNVVAGRIDPALHNTAWGYEADMVTTGGQNTAVGAFSLQNNTSGARNTAVGYWSLLNNHTGSGNTAVGWQSLGNEGTNNTAIGAEANTLGIFTNATAIGYEAVVRASNAIQLGNDKVTMVTAGGKNTTFVTAGLQVTGGHLAAGNVLTSDATGIATWQPLPTAMGANGWNLTGNAGTVDGTNFIGTTDDIPLTFRVNNLLSGRIDPTLMNAFWGYQAAANNAGSNNTALGNQSLLTNTSGDGLLALGAGADVATGNINNASAIGYDAIVHNSNSMQLGNGKVTTVYLGSGSTTLITAGLQVTGGNLAAGNVLTSDSNGIATWKPIPASTGSGSGTSGWNLTGNAGTVDGTNFIGTTDLVPFNIRVDNFPSGRIDHGYGNAFWGYGAGANDGNVNAGTIGIFNTGIGESALTNNTGGLENTAVGSSALTANATGNANTSVGYGSLLSNTTGIKNTAVGNATLDHNLTGSYLTAIGAAAGVSIDGLTNATAVGNGALVKASNTIQLGNSAVDSIYAGVGTTATLVTGGLKVTGGTLASGNVLTSDANGVATWQPLPSGTGTGSGTSGWSLTGNAGTVDGTNFIGTTDLVPLTIKVENNQAGRIDLALNAYWGYEAGLNTLANISNYTGIQNTLIGAYAGGFNTTGSSNIAVGGYALYNTTSTNNCTAVGYDAGATVDGITNATAIGYTAFATASNQVAIGNANVTSIGGYANWTNFSDGRYKQNIKQNVPGLTFINALQPITYTLDINGIQNKIRRNQQPIKGPDGKPLPQPGTDQAATTESANIIHTGFIAQDVETAAQKLGYDFSGVDKPKDASTSFYGLRYGDFVVPLVKAVQELSSKNDSLTAVVAQLQDSLNNVVAQMNDRLTRLEAALGSGTFSKNSGSAILSDAKLYQNVPNPFSQTTLINYYLPDNAGQALIQVTDMNGALIKSIAVNGSGSGQLTLATSQLAAGTYAYSLIINGTLIDTKQMLLVK